MTRTVDCAGVLAFDDALNVLLVKIRRRRTWEHPGGQLRRGETLRAAAARELREETGLIVDRDALVLLGMDHALGVPFTAYVARVPGIEPRIHRARLELSCDAWCDRDVARLLIRIELVPRLVAAYDSPALGG